MPVLKDDIPAAEKAARRREWLREEAVHEQLARKWDHDRAIFEEAERAWSKERAQWEAVRESWDEERMKWDDERRAEERHRRMVERRRQGVYWTEPVGDAQCHSYNTRAYRAILKDVPHDLNWLEVCSEMPIGFRTRVIDRPDGCERNVITPPLMPGKHVCSYFRRSTETSSGLGISILMSRFVLRTG